ncbi:hypothetical protein [Dietzia sp. 179-F 9C3 NHS]|uniref:hypothetical protein n=1 Tax=Dietzia sp. 179-F 9C3 NHS TaxID=3374295 RepID=UPI00387A74B3
MRTLTSRSDIDTEIARTLTQAGPLLADYDFDAIAAECWTRKNGTQWVPAVTDEQFRESIRRHRTW